MIFEDYKTECKTAAMDPSAPGKEPAGRKLGTQADWLTEIQRGVTIPYSCRFGACRWYGQNNQWIANAALSYFRCPLCKLEYQPWSESRGQLPPPEGSARHEPEWPTLCVPMQVARQP